METNVKQLLAFREIITILIQNSLLLSIKEKEEFLSATLNMELNGLIEMFNLLVRSRRNVDDILIALAIEYPQVAKELDTFQKETIKNIYKAQRHALKN